MFAAEPSNIVLIALSRGHPFYEKFWKQAEDNGSADPLQLLLCAHVLAQQEDPDIDFDYYNSSQSTKLQQQMRFFHATGLMIGMTQT